MPETTHADLLPPYPAPAGWNWTREEVPPTWAETIGYWLAKVRATLDWYEAASRVLLADGVEQRALTERIHFYLAEFADLYESVDVRVLRLMFGEDTVSLHAVDRREPMQWLGERFGSVKVSDEARRLQNSLRALRRGVVYDEHLTVSQNP